MKRPSGNADRTGKEPKMSSDILPKLHNAMWPGLVGKGNGPGQEPPISLERMLELTAGAEVDGQKFDGIDYFLFLPHTDPNASDSQLRKIADLIQGYGFRVGSLVAPVWPGTVGDSAMRDDSGPQEIPQRCADGVPDRRRLQQAWRAQVRRDPDRFGGVWRRGVAQGPQGRTPRESPRRSAKRPRLPPITGNAWPPRARFAGPACTVGRPCSISWKKSECRRPWVSRPIWPIRTCI